MVSRGLHFGFITFSFGHIREGYTKVNFISLNGIMYLLTREQMQRVIFYKKLLNHIRPKINNLEDIQLLLHIS